MISAQRVQVGVALLLGGRPAGWYRCAAGTPWTARPPSGFTCRIRPWPRSRARPAAGSSPVREFRDDERITGCALADFQARYLIALRLRSTTQGNADLRGDHPIVLEARDADAAERLRSRATALGIPWTSGTHADGTWTQFTDPDGICLRVVHDAAGPQTFLGVSFGRDGSTRF
jgi:hypothetical protein